MRMMKKQELVETIIENPKGSNHCYQKDENLNCFSLVRMMSKGMVFPYDFGYIQHTQGSKGELLRTIVINDSGTFCGCRIYCRAIGGLVVALEKHDGTITYDDYHLVVPCVEGSQRVKTLADLPPIILENLKSFFINYHAAEGKVKFTHQWGHLEAIKIIKKASTADIVNIKLELILPEKTSGGKPFPETYFEELQEELVNKFGGLTVYSRITAQGFWKKGTEAVQQDVVVYELMLSKFDAHYWKQMKLKLERKFNQDEVMITYGPSNKVS